MADSCPTCGAAVQVVGSGEGTMHYEPCDEARIRADQTERIVAWLRQPQGMGGDSIRRMADANAIAQKFGLDGDVAL